MSRTIRVIKNKNRKGKTIVKKGGDAMVDKSASRKKKMRPYSTKLMWKDKPFVSEYRKAPSKEAKLLSKNANRATKKGLRQAVKKEIKESLSEKS